MLGVARSTHLLIVASCIGCLGCDTPLRSNLTEHDADALIVLLDSAAISASKQLDPATRRYRIEVSTLEVGAALRALEANGELRRKDPTIAELYGQASLVPTPVEEHTRLTLAMEGELARTLERIDGVLEARVHLALPRAQQLDVPPPPASASVLLRRKHASPAIDQAQVQAIVEGAVTQLERARVSVVQIEASAPSAAAGLTRVGPFSVARSSAPWLHGVLITGLGLNAALALLLIVTLKRARGAHGSRPDSPSRTRE